MSRFLPLHRIILLFLTFILLGNNVVLAVRTIKQKNAQVKKSALAKKLEEKKVVLEDHTSEWEEEAIEELPVGTLYPTRQAASSSPISYTTASKTIASNNTPQTTASVYVPPVPTVTPVLEPQPTQVLSQEESKDEGGKKEEKKEEHKQDNIEKGKSSEHKK